VREAVASLPPGLLESVHNVDIVIERRPTAGDLKLAGVGPRGLLLGLYHGIPLTERGGNYNLVAPDKISIYQEHIEMLSEDEDVVREQIRKTVLHELGHYFGIDDDRLHELGMG
jgi:predicted Zn-dependent protease with MMP-like domain